MNKTELNKYTIFCILRHSMICQPTCKVLPGSGKLVFLSTFFRVYSGSTVLDVAGFSPGVVVSAGVTDSTVVTPSLPRVTGKISVVGTCSVTVNSGSFVARKLVIMLECSFCKRKKNILLFFTLNFIHNRILLLIF